MAIPTTRALRHDEHAVAVDTLARSFDDDPWFRWALPDERDRREWLMWFHGVSLSRALREGTAFTLSDGPAQGAITVMPPGIAGPQTLDWIRALLAPPRRAPTWRLASTGLRTLAALEALHPREPVVYVHVLGVHPSQKGKGLGSALLREAIALAARRAVPLFLETSNPENLGFYRRFGLRQQGEINLGDAPPVWVMKSDGPPEV